MDEELAVWAEIDEWFDFSKDHLFLDALRSHDGLVNQIFPTERCVLVMAVTRRDIDYGDSWANAERNARNRCVFLLVRNGMSIYRVFSSVESHLGTSRLFPSKNDQDQIFRGYDGAKIKFEDVAYTDKLAAHEKYALHYKRFLLLVCGLDHRLKLFGEFYDGPPSLDFVSLAFQDKYCRFLHDDDGWGMLPSFETRPSLSEWIQEKNAYLRSGSRVLCCWHSLMNPDTSPGACKRDYSSSKGFDVNYRPLNALDTVIAYRQGSLVCVDVEVENVYGLTDRRFNCKVNLSNFKSGSWQSHELAYLCLDAVMPQDLEWYIHNRSIRGDHLFYIRFFKTALKFIREERAQETDTRQRLAKALADGAIATGVEAEQIIDQAVIAWRAAHRGKPLPAFDIHQSAPTSWKSLLDQLYMLAGQGKRMVVAIESHLQASGYKPLRLVLSSGAKLVVYAAPLEHERDDRLTPHVWVHRISLETGKIRILENSRRWAMLPKAEASETTIYQWDSAQKWLHEPSPFGSYENKQDILAITHSAKSLISDFAGPMTSDVFSKHFQDWKNIRSILLDGSKNVRNPVMAVPFGVLYFHRTKELKFLCVGTLDPHALLWQLTPDQDARRKIRSEFVSVYAKKSHAENEFDSDCRNVNLWSLLELTVGSTSLRNSVFVKKGVPCFNLQGRKHSDPLLSNLFENWKAEFAGDAKYWIPSEFFEDKTIFFDRFLGIERHKDYDPMILRHVSLTPSTQGLDFLYCEWFDILPVSIFEEQVKKSEWNNNYNKQYVPQGYLYSASTVETSTLAEAYESLKKLAPQGKKVVEASEIEGAPLPSTGGERWYVIG